MVIPVAAAAALKAAPTIIGGVQALGSMFGSNKDSASDLARQQFNYQKLLNQQAYDLTQQGYREGPGNMRFGWESAGFNPILALGGSGTSFGTYSGGSASMPHGSSSSDMGNMVTNAYKVFSLMKDKNTAEIAGINAGINNTNADTSLKEEQAITENTRRLHMEADIEKTRLEAILLDKDASNYEKKLAADIYHKITSAEAAAGQATAAALNAETNRKMNAANIADAELAEEWIRKHPVLHSTGKNIPVATGAVRDIGLGFGGAKGISFGTKSTGSKSKMYSDYKPPKNEPLSAKEKAEIDAIRKRIRARYSKGR